MKMTRKRRRNYLRQCRQDENLGRAVRMGLSFAAAGLFLWNPLTPQQVQAMPVGPQVAAGAAGVSQNGNAMTVRQQTQNAILNWQSFNLAANERVQFLQPNSAAAILNRVVGGAPSQIFGAISANGRVFLINPGGVLFAPGSQINVGSLVASTMNITNADFMAGRFAFINNGKDGKVINQGRIVAENKGLVALLAPDVENSGVIVARKGTIALAAGHEATLDFNGDGKVEVAPGSNALKAAVTNKGLVEADGGIVLMTAKAGEDLTSAVVNQDGIVRAQSLDGKAGKVTLQADNGTVNQTGTVDATSQEGKGGSVDAFAKAVNVTGTIDASGTQGGGNVRVGGDWQGSGDAPHAQNTTVSKTAVIKADATENGNGGKVAVWSDGTTNFAGQISAKGAGSGDGGKVETSGHQLQVQGNVDASAKNGKSGEWLLDPYNVEIVAKETTGASDMSDDSYTPTSDTSKITNTSVNTALAGKTNVTITTGSTGSQDGNITVTAAIDSANANGTTLSLHADNNIIVNADIKASTGTLNVDLQSDTNGTGGGAITLASAATISTNGGYVIMHGGHKLKTTDADGYANSQSSGEDGIKLAGNITTNGGNVTLLGSTSQNDQYGVVISGNINTAAAAGTAGTVDVKANGGAVALNDTAGTITAGTVNIAADTVAVAGKIQKAGTAAGNVTLETLTDGKNISLGGGSDGLVLDSTALDKISGFENTVIGNSNTGTITTAGNTVIDSNVTLNAKNIALANTLQAGSSTKKNLTLNVGTALSGTGAVQADTLDIEATGKAVSLTNASNDVNSIKGTTGDLKYTDANDFKVGTLSTGAATLTAASGTMELTDALKATGDVALSAGTIMLDDTTDAKGTIQANGKNISLIANTFTLPDGSLTSSKGVLSIDKKTANSNLAIGTGMGADLAGTGFATDGFSQINIGSKTTGAVTIGTLDVKDPLKVTSGAGITVSGAVTSNSNALGFDVEKQDGKFTTDTTASIAAGSADITVTADKLSLGGTFAATNTGTLTLAPYATGQAFTVGGSDTAAYVKDADLAKTAVGFTNVVVGSESAGAVTVAGTGTTMPSYLTIKSGGAASITGSAGATGKTFVLDAQGVTQSAALSGNLLLLGKGDDVLNNDGNALQTVAAKLDSGTVSITNNADLTVGSLENRNSTTAETVNGINTSGVVSLTTTADKALTFAGNIVAGAGKVTLSADTITDTSGKVTTSGVLQIYPTTVSKTIMVGGTGTGLNLPAADFESGAFSGTYSKIILGELKSNTKVTPADTADQKGSIQITTTTFTSPLELRTTAGTTFTGTSYIGASGDKDLTIHAASATLDTGSEVHAGNLELDLSNGMDLGDGKVVGSTGKSITFDTPEADIYLAQSNDSIPTGGYKIAYSTLNNTLSGYDAFTVKSATGKSVYLQEGSLNKSGTITGAAGVEVTGNVSIVDVDSTKPADKEVDIYGGSFKIDAGKTLDIQGSASKTTTINIQPTGNITLAGDAASGGKLSVSGKAAITLDGGSGSTVTLGQNSGITVAGDSAKVTVAGGTVALGANAKIDLGTGTTSVFTLKADTLSAADARTDGDSTAKTNIIGSGTLNLSTYSVGRNMYVESVDSSSSKDGLHVLQGDINGDIFGSGFTNLNIGNASGTGTVNVNRVKLDNSVTIQNGSAGTIDFQGANSVASGKTVTLKAGKISDAGGTGTFAADGSTLNIYTNDLTGLTGQKKVTGTGTLGISTYGGSTAINLGTAGTGLNITTAMLDGSGVFGTDFTHYSIGSTTPNQQIINVDGFTPGKNTTLTAQTINFNGAMSVGTGTLALNASSGTTQEADSAITAGSLALQGGDFNLAGANAVGTLAAKATSVNFMEAAKTKLTIGSVTTLAGAQTATTTLTGISTTGDVTLTTDQIAVKEAIKPTTTDQATLTIQQTSKDGVLNIGDQAATTAGLNLGTDLFNNGTIENQFKQVNLGNGTGAANISSTTGLNFYDPTTIRSGTAGATSSTGSATTITTTSITTHDNPLTFEATTFKMDSGSTISAGTGNLTFTTDTLDVAGANDGNISGTGEVTIRTLNKGLGIDLGDTSTSTTNLELPSGYFEDGNTTARVFHDGYSVINFGQADGTGTLTQSGETNFTDKVNILQGETGGNGIVVQGTINTGANDFDVKSKTVTITNAHVTTTTGNVNITTDTLINDTSSKQNTIESTNGGSLTITTYTKDKKITLGATGDGLNINDAWFNSDTKDGLFKGFSNVTFGDSTQTGGVTIGTINTTNVTNVTNIVTQGAVTDGGTGGITTTTLNITTDSTSDVTLTSTSNKITNIGDVTGQNVTLTTGETGKTTTVTGTVTGAKVVKISTPGNVAIAKGGKVKSTGSNVDIEATKGHFTNTDGGADVVSTSAGGHWVIHTDDSIGDTPGALAGAIRYGTSDGDISNLTSNTFAYVYQPMVTIYSERTYGDSNDTFFSADNKTYSCVMEGNRIISSKQEQSAFDTLVTTAKSNTSGTYGWSKVGANTSVNAKGGPNAGKIYGTGGETDYAITYGGANPMNYKIETKFVINPRTVVVQANSDTKTYDGKNYTGGKGSTYETGVNGQGFIENDRDTNGAPKSGVVTGGSVRYGQVSTPAVNPNAEGERNVGTYSIGIQGSNLTSNGNYVFQYKDGTLTISPRAITVTTDNASRVYGAANPTNVKAKSTNTAANEGLAAGDAASASVTIDATKAGSTLNVDETAPITVDSVVIKNASGEDVTGNYTITKTDGTLSITPRPLTITEGDKSRVYGETNDTAKYTTAKEYTIAATDTTNNTGLVNGDTVASVTQGIKDGITVSSNAGTYADGTTVSNAAITRGNVDVLKNYTVTYVAGKFVITPRPVDVTVTNTTKTYGDANPTATATAATGMAGTGKGLLNGDALTNITTTYDSSINEKTHASATPYANVINSSDGTFTGSNAGNYSFNYGKGAITITPRLITVTADNATRVYGSTAPSQAAAKLSTGTLASGDTLGSVTVTSNAAVYSPVGNAYTMTPSNFTLAAGSNGVASDYQVTYVNGGLSITPRPVYITEDNKTRVYGEDNSTAVYQTTNGGTTHFTVRATDTVNNTGLVNGDTVASTTEGNVDTSVTNTSNVGTYKTTVGVAGAVMGAGSASNYEFHYTNGDFVITPRPVDVTVTNTSKTYGDANPAATASAAAGTVGTGRGLINGDTLTNITTTYDSSINEKTHASATPYANVINSSDGTFTGSNAGNYSFNYGKGAITITPRPITVTADNATRVYGSDTPSQAAAKLSAGTLVNGDKLGSVTVTSSAAANSPVGSGYTTTPSALVLAMESNGYASDYQVTYVNGSLTITPRPVLIQAGDASRGMGQDNPAVSAYAGAVAGNPDSGLVFGDQLGGLMTTYDSAMNAQTQPGRYAGVIHPGNLASYATWYFLAGRSASSVNNYSFLYAPGTLTIGMVQTPAQEQQETVETISNPQRLQNPVPEVGAQPVLPILGGNTLVVAKGGIEQPETFVDTDQWFGIRFNGNTGNDDIGGRSSTNGAVPVLFTDGTSKKLDGIYKINYDADKLAIEPAAQKTTIPDPKEIMNDVNKDFMLTYQSQEAGSYDVTFGNGIVAIYPVDPAAFDAINGDNHKTIKWIVSTGILTSIQDLGVTADQIRAVYIFTTPEGTTTTSTQKNE